MRLFFVGRKLIVFFFSVVWMVELQVCLASNQRNSMFLACAKIVYITVCELNSLDFFEFAFGGQPQRFEASLNVLVAFSSYQGVMFYERKGQGVIGRQCGGSKTWRL